MHVVYYRQSFPIRMAAKLIRTLCRIQLHLLLFFGSTQLTSAVQELSNHTGAEFVEDCL